MATAYEIVDAMMAHVRPPEGTEFTIRKREPKYEGDANWDMASGVLSIGRTVKFSEKIAELRKTHPIVEFGDV